jgi:uncharacterized protein
MLGGRLRTIIDKWRAGKFVLIVSEGIVREYLEVIRRPKFKVSSTEVATTTDYLLKTAEFVTPLETVTAVEADPTDNKFLEAALAGKAVYVVSGDGHLLELKTFRGALIITARDFIERLENLA